MLDCMISIGELPRLICNPNKIVFHLNSQAVQEPSILDECELDEEIKKVLLENIKQKLTQQAVKIRADIEVSVML